MGEKTLKLDKADFSREVDKKMKDKKNKSLSELLSEITPQNVHKEIDWGEPVGKELW